MQLELQMAFPFCVGNTEWAYCGSRVEAVVESTKTGALLQLESKSVVLVAFDELTEEQREQLERLPRRKLNSAG